LFKTLETVAVDTPAALATSRIVRPMALAFSFPRPTAKLHQNPDYRKSASGPEYKSKKVLDTMQISVILGRLSG
jgi:hypothetical protein